MKRLCGRLVTVCINLLFATGSWSVLLPAQAWGATPPPTTITVQETPPPSVAPDIIITTIASGASPLDYVEIYNQSDAPINLSKQALDFVMSGMGAADCASRTAEITFPDNWLLSKKYLTLHQTTNPVDGDLAVPFAIDPTATAGCTGLKLKSVAIVFPDKTNGQVLNMINAADGSVVDLTGKVAQHKQRNNSPSSTRSVSGTFDDYKVVTGDIKLNSDPLYTPPTDAAGLQILEILPNARNCSPLETDPICTDYVKLFNPTDQPINLALYRMRTGYKGASESVTNTFTWNRGLDPANDELILPPQMYFMLSARNDGQPLSVTDSGSYIWLEDAYGTTMYEPIVQYPDASSTTKIGAAWAYDGTAWRWTTAPQPNTANYFPPEVIVPSTNTSSAVSVESDLKPCADNQYRNPITHRCNTIVTASAALTPCDEGEERNPATNRCRAIVTTASELTPCQPGWERNPATNRCRKSAEVAGDATIATTVKDVAAPATSNTGWFVAALAIGIALFYGLYEWRQEIRLFTTRNTAAAMAMIGKFLKRP